MTRSGLRSSLVPFTKDDDGMYIGKAKLKGAYGKDATNKPKQYDAKNKELARGLPANFWQYG